MDKYYFCFDYLSGIVPLCNVDSFFESLQNIDFTFDRSLFINSCFAVRGIRNYNTRFHFQGKNEFIVAWNRCNDIDVFSAKSPDESKFNPYIYITISGSGLNYFSSDSRKHFFSYLHRVGFKCTRFDVACDIFNSDNNIVPYILQSFKFTSRMRKPEGVPFVSSNMSLEPKFDKKTGRCKRPVQYTYVSDIYGNESENLTVGNHGSDLGMFRVYDKFLERGFDISSPVVGTASYDIFNTFYPDRYYYRIEVELHKKHSSALFNLMVSQNLELYDVFASALVSMFTVKISKSSGYQNQFCDVSPVWQSFLDELSSHIHFVELPNKSSVPVVSLPIEELKAKLKHYAPMLCAYEDLCELDSDFHSSINVVERYRYENKFQYQYLRQLLFRERQRLSNMILV